jgi:DNA-binding NtrC family response regulator
MLARHFVQKHAERCKVKPRPISREAILCLVNYDWPGNVRELENAIEYAMVLGTSEMILPEDLPEALLERTAPQEIIEAKYHASVKELKKQLILDAMKQTQGSYADAARILGVHPNYLHRLIRNLELKEAINELLRGLSGGNGAVSD